MQDTYEKRTPLSVDESSEIIPDRLATYLHGLFTDSAHHRYARDFHHLGIYDEMKSRTYTFSPQTIVKSENDLRQPQSKDDSNINPARLRIVKTKVMQTVARQNELVLGGGHSSWDISPTEKPKVSQQALAEAITEKIQERHQEMVQDIQALPPEGRQAMADAGELPVPLERLDAVEAEIAQGRVPHEYQLGKEELADIVKEVVKKRSDKMRQVIRDQITESHLQRELREVLRSGDTYGTGFLRGPMTEEVEYTEYEIDEESGQYQEVTKTKLRPFFEYATVWDTYPYPAGCTDLKQTLGMFRRQILSRQQLQAYTSGGGYDEAVINEYINERPQGDADYVYPWESIQRDMDPGDQTSRQRPGMYEVLEYTGWLDNKMLADAGNYIDMEKLHEGKRYSITFLGYRIIRMVPTDIDDWYMFEFEPDEGSLYAEGLVDTQREPARLAQASYLGLIDDLANAGHITQVNTEYLGEGQASRAGDIGAGSVVPWHGKGDASGRPPVTVSTLTPRTSEFAAALSIARELMDETTGMPRMAGGMPDGGTENTVGVTHMRQQNATTVLKDPTQNFLEGVLHPVIKALYAWNMKHGPDEIKGDFEVKISSMNDLLAKEVEVQQLEQFAMGTANPFDAKWVKRGDLVRKRAGAAGMDADDVVYTDKEMEDIEQREQARMMEQSMEQGQVGPEG